MKRALALVVVAGCASGSGTAVQDAPVADAKAIDAEVIIDAPIIQPIDAPADATIDASIDAMIDAPMIDAPMIDAPCVPVNSELLANPVLDLSPEGHGWQQVLIDPVFPLVTGDGVIVEHSAPFKAWLGGLEAELGLTVTDVLYQDVIVPANTTQLVLTAQYDVRTGELPQETTVFDSASIDLTQPNGTPLVTVRALSNLTPTTGWTAVNHTFTQPFAGQTVRLRFTSTNDFFRATSFYFDTFSLRALHCP